MTNYLMVCLLAFNLNFEQKVDTHLLSGDFEQHKTIQLLSKPLISHGQFFYIKDKGIIWKVNQPLASQLYFSWAGRIRSFDGNQLREVNAKRSAKLKVLKNILLALFSKDWLTLEKYFSQQQMKVDKGWYIQLRPKASHLGFFIKTIDLFGSEHASKIIINEKNGDKTEIFFSNVNTQPSLPSQQELEYLQ